MKNYYRILNVPSDAPTEIVKASYRKLAKQYHPDTNPGDPSAAAFFADICEAYSVLSDDTARMAYDAQRQYENTQSQLATIRDGAYREGYAIGYKDGQLHFAAQLADNEQNRRDLEQELFNRDRELGKANAVICDLLTQLSKYHLGDEPLRRNKSIGHAYQRYAEHLAAKISPAKK